VGPCHIKHENSKQGSFVSSYLLSPCRVERRREGGNTGRAMIGQLRADALPISDPTRCSWMWAAKVDDVGDAQFLQLLDIAAI
jgi:hypothetical protein